MNLISRREAKAAGLKTYFTGIPCINGHVEIRSVANTCCYQCRRDAQNRHRLNNLDGDRARSKRWYAANKTKAAKWKRDWIANNPEQYKARRIRYRGTPDGRAIEMFNAAKWSARAKSINFDLDVAWIRELLEKGECQLTGIKFDLAPLDGGRQNPYTASLDRIIPKNGYVKTNVRMILWALNAAFNSYGEGVYADVARAYLARHPHSTGLT